MIPFIDRATLEAATLTPQKEDRAYRNICPTCNKNTLLTQMEDAQHITKRCYICRHVVVLSSGRMTMKYKDGDRVHLVKQHKEGVVIHTQGTRAHPYYVSFDADKDADFFAETDIEPSRIPVLDDATIDRILYALSVYGDPAMMRAIVREAMVSKQQLPERRDVSRTVSELDKKIAEDAALFEEQLGCHPDRYESTTLPWGWRYVSDTIQTQFREYCLGAKKAKETL